MAQFRRWYQSISIFVKHAEAIDKLISRRHRLLLSAQPLEDHLELLHGQTFDAIEVREQQTDFGFGGVQSQGANRLAQVVLRNVLVAAIIVQTED